MEIKAFDRDGTKESESLYLVKDNWNDYNYFSTFRVYHRKNQKDEYLGNLNLAPVTYMTIEDKENINEKDLNAINQDKYISLGGESYYIFLNKLPDVTRERILQQLGDLAFNIELFDKYKDLGVVRTSFLRGRTAKNVKGKLHRLATGNIRFTYDFDIFNKEDSHKLINISMDSTSLLPTNIHAFIGNNGAGKTKFLKNVALACAGEFKFVYDENWGEDEFRSEDSMSGSDYSATFRFSSDDQEDVIEEFSNLNVIYFSYSPFDNYSNFQNKNITKIGLDQIELGSSIDSYMLDLLDDVLNNEVKNEDDGFSRRAIIGSLIKVKMWNKMIGNLNFDKNIQRISENLIFESDAKNSKYKKIEKTTIKALSSGQKVLLLSLAKLINEATERSIIIIDEPELFLHPPLITSYIREISNVLMTTNSLCLIATHSPFVVQEVPKECVHIVNNNNGEIEISEPKTRTFGENISVINQGIFGTDLRLTGYFKLLEELSKNDKEKALRLIESEQLSYEGEVILKSLIRTRDKNVEN